jgi:hypothetical protein
LHGARIAGQLTFRDAVLAGTPVAVHLGRLQADELCLRTSQLAVSTSIGPTVLH